MVNDGSRKLYIAVLRIISCMAVVLVHSVSNFIRLYGEVRPLIVLGASIRWCVPVFFMITGACMLNSPKEYDWKTMKEKTINRVIRPYLIWSCIYQIVYCFQSQTVSVWIKFPIKVILGQGWYHLWYLYVLIGIYICIPVAKYE